jgi:hypothetical protein
MEPQQIIDACEADWDAHKDDCSGYVRAVCGTLGITSFEPGDNADAIVGILEGSPDWQRLADGPAAKGAADAGCFVIAGLRGADHNPPHAHGHVVVVVSGPLASGKYPTAYWGSLGSVGAKYKTINWSWRATDRDNVEYFGRP